jgi:hypothetical protein
MITFLPLAPIYPISAQKLATATNGPKYFLPANLKLGAANTWNLDENNQITVAFDINKLLTPTPPIKDARWHNIISGKNDDVSVPSGIFQSFGDAPGGFSEELKEIAYRRAPSTGIITSLL